MAEQKKIRRFLFAAAYSVVRDAARVAHNGVGAEGTRRPALGAPMRGVRPSVWGRSRSSFLFASLTRPALRLGRATRPRPQAPTVPPGPEFQRFWIWD